MSKIALVLSPHTDDADIGCAATLLKLKESGWEIFSTAFSPCKKSVPAGHEEDALAKEWNQAQDVLGFSSRRLFDYPVREFPAHRQEILENIIDLKKALAPSLVFLPCSTDVHQDHRTIHEEGVRAFKMSATILGWELPWNATTGCSLAAVVPVTKEHVERKLLALNCYTTQKEIRDYAHPDVVRGLAVLHGTRIVAPNKNEKEMPPLAEAFEVIRWIIQDL